jgi:hypothetical protein
VSVGLVNAVIPFLKGGWKCGLILHHFLASWTGGPLGWKSTQYGNNLRQVSHLIIFLAKQFLGDKGSLQHLDQFTLVLPYIEHMGLYLYKSLELDKGRNTLRGLKQKECPSSFWSHLLG